MSDPHLHPSTAHVATAALNQTVGDWKGNTARIVEAARAASALGARLLVLPEMCIPGYSLGDRLPRRGTLERSWQALEQIKVHTADLIVCVGLPISHRGVLFNAMAVVANTQIVGLVAKEHLATGDVEYESRWYSGWPHGRIESFSSPSGQEIPIGSLVFEASGLGRFALEICEDGWKGIRPGSRYALAGAEIICNPSASWFTLGKHAARKRLVEQASLEDHCAYLYTSLLGCDATRLIFDGSTLIAADGKTLGEGRRFVFDAQVEIVDCVLDLDALRLARREEGSWRQQVGQAAEGELGPMPEMIRVAGDFSSSEPVDAQEGNWWAPSDTPHPDPSLAWLETMGITRSITHPDVPHLELELALALALRDYTSKSGIRKLAIALSGGRDSAMVALLVHRMFRYEHPELDLPALDAVVNQALVTAYLPTDHSGEATRLAAAGLAEAIGATHHEINIQSAVSLHRELLEGSIGRELSWENTVEDLALQNVQARLRGSMIWMLANLDQALLLSTSNKSEAAVGYTTMDGDTSGGLSPIADVPKSLVMLWLSWARDFHNYSCLDPIEALEPTAELRPPEQSQTDEDDLMPFEVLDTLLYHFVEKGQDPVAIFEALWPSMQDRYNHRPDAFASDIKRFVKMLCGAQWKRERFAISFRVSAFDLDPKTGFRFPAVQAPFTEELADLDAHVANLAQET
ncbi:MAG: NAD(+) synthase [Myxococcota bacterium]|nr:NAD(+) synthase [Myxococcota bacterium]